MNLKPTLALGVATLLALALPATAADPTISVPDPSFAVTGTQALAGGLQGAATGFATGVSGAATGYAAAVQSSCTPPTDPGVPACSPPVPASALFGLVPQATGLADGVAAAATGFANSGIQSNLAAIATAKISEAQAVSDALLGGATVFGDGVGQLATSVNTHVCDTTQLPTVPPAGAPSTAGLCGATTFVGQARATASGIYAGAKGLVGSASLTPACDSLNAGLGKLGPAPANPLPCSALPKGSDAAALLPPAP
jgi:hypothetical protein